VLRSNQPKFVIGNEYPAGVDCFAKSYLHPPILFSVRQSILSFYRLWWSSEGIGKLRACCPGWSVDFTTANAILWFEEVSGAGFLGCSPDGPLFEKDLYGPGGSFFMTGPQGLTFSGIVTGGSYIVNTFTEVAAFRFVGHWSNGLVGVGSYDFVYQNDYAFHATTLDTSIAPEPGSLFILGTGVIGAGYAIRRRLIG
jgi:hypothetical protein